MDEFQRTTQYLKRSMEAYDENGNFAYPVKDQSEESFLSFSEGYLMGCLIIILINQGITTVADIKSGKLVKQIKSVVTDEQYKNAEQYFKKMENDIVAMRVDSSLKNKIISTLNGDDRLELLNEIKLPLLDKFKNWIEKKTIKAALKNMLNNMVKNAMTYDYKEFQTNNVLIGNDGFVCSYSIKGKNNLLSRAIKTVQSLRADNEFYGKVRNDMNKKLSVYNVKKGPISRNFSTTELSLGDKRCTIYYQIGIDMKNPEVTNLLKPIMDAIKDLN